MSVFDVLKERGYIAQLTHEDEIKELLEKERVTFYIGFDPTADSLHVGHFLQLMVMSHMQKAGHRPIALLGGGTAMVGDPTGKTDMRKMLSKETIDQNAECFKKQMQKFIDFSDDKAIMANNADWLLNLNYVEFLREIGVHFSVNRMLTAESVKQRLERGLTFLEFNYMLMQGYDFLELNRRYGCIMQLGGDDQWSNIIAGVELIRKKESKPAYGMTFTLLTTSEGKKMGKTEKGAVWLDPEKTSPYDFYQYWRNINDADVEKCLALLTFLPMDEVRRLGALKDKEINEAKKILAYEITKIVHGQEEAEKAKKAAEALFESGGNLENIPTSTIPKDFIGSKLVDILLEASIVPSKGEAKRLIQQGGLYVNDEKITDIDTIADDKMFKDGKILVRKGKKTYNQIVIK
ncbi:tyrosine--tRNA ligase [Caloramator sp. E03]|uniref:tyrosine--tRNA ligase n=1 Tax=Caloramator sp. E03 TaxID=2576307 RepID=UPI0011104504|nr:tyrosine--tRNA ligase [Caloramator sp. E03]QCX34535.1 tyrosine--tRNA ligase [Caloramator sp. E03]